MKITYIHHSSFSVELDNSILLFDYFKGKLPDFDKSKPIGYKDLSHINNTYGDRVAQSNNQNNK